MPYQPGSFFLTTISGPAGFAVGVAQALAGSPSRYEHAGILINADGATVEAEPGGARTGHISDYAGRPLLVSDAPVRQYLAANPGANEEDVRLSVTFAAHDLLGTPYSGLDYLALALLHLHLPSGWVRRRVESSGHLICSALVDRAMANAGVHIFDDGRLPGDVTPADLAAFAEDAAAAA